VAFKLCRHSGTQRAYVNQGGKRIYLGPWANYEPNPPLEVQAKYHQLIAGLLVESQNTSDKPESEKAIKPHRAITLMRLCDQYLDWAKVAYQKSKYHQVMEWSFRFLLARYRTLKASDFSPLKLKQVMEDAVNFRQHKKGKPKRLSRQGVNRILACTLALFKWAVEHEHVTIEVKMALECVSPLKKGRTNAPESKGRKSISIDVVKRSLPLYCPLIRSMVEILMYTGMRPTELFSMRNGDISFTTENLAVYRPRTHKTEHHGRIRQVAFGPKAVQALKDWHRPDKEQEFVFSPKVRVKLQNQEKVRNRKTPRQPSQKLTARRFPFPQKTPGKAYDRTTFLNAVVRPIKKYNELNPETRIEQWSPSLLKKVWAQLVRDEMGLEASRAALGHSSPEITAEHYARSDLKLAMDAAIRLG